MPESWSDKDERQYEHIKSSAKKEGRSTKTAKRIAAATVNKQRSSEGRTKSGGSKKSSGAKKSASKKGASKKSSARKSSSSKRSSSSSRSKKAAAGRKGGKATARKRSRS